MRLPAENPSINLQALTLKANASSARAWHPGPCTLCLLQRGLPPTPRLSLWILGPKLIVMTTWFVWGTTDNCVPNTLPPTVGP